MAIIRQLCAPARMPGCRLCFSRTGGRTVCCDAAALRVRNAQRFVGVGERAAFRPQRIKCVSIWCERRVDNPGSGGSSGSRSIRDPDAGCSSYVGRIISASQYSRTPCNGCLLLPAERMMPCAAFITDDDVITRTNGSCTVHKFRQRMATPW